MQFASCSAPYHDGNVQSGTLHFVGHVDHFLQAGRDESRKSYHVHLLFYGLAYYLFGGHHHPHVDDVVVVARHDDPHDVLANIVDVTLNGS